MTFHSLGEWITQRLADERGVWPWAEHNQGLLSVAALVAALAVAVYEVKRAARSESSLLVEYVDWVLNCANRSIELTKDAVGTIEGTVSGIDAMPLALWRFLNSNAMATLEEAQPLRPTHPRLAHHVNRLLRCMAMDVKGEDATPEALRELRQILDMVETGAITWQAFDQRGIANGLQIGCDNCSKENVPGTLEASPRLPISWLSQP